MDETSVTKFHNYLRLQLLLTNWGCDVLRKIFKQRFRLTGIDWDDGETSRRFYKNKGKKVYKKLSEAQKRAVRIGDIAQWDLPLLATLLLDVTYQVSKEKAEEIEFENGRIQSLIKLHDEVASWKRQSIADMEFIYVWDGIHKILKNLGVPIEEMRNALFAKKLEELEYKNFGVSTENIAKAVQLREEGSRAVMSEDFKVAIDLFTKALLLRGLSVSERSSLLCQRSSAYRKVYQITKNQNLSFNYANLALEDAKLCIRCRPTWWEGYYLAGQAYLLKGDRKTAFGSFNHALSLNPNSQDILKARGECQKVEDYEEMPPTKRPLKKVEPISTKDLEDARRQQKLASWSAVVLAHRFLKGEGKAQSYNNAVSLFAKAACSGNAEAAYNLGILYLRGEGVPKNEATAFQYFRLAANSLEDTLELKHVGEVESMYELGKCWERGVGTRLDYSKAAHWYFRASKEGCGEASNRLAFLHRDGQGVQRCPLRAIQFWRLAADQGVIAAMVTLAYEYVLTGDLDEAQLWYSRAIEHGDHHAKDNERVFIDALQAKQQLLDKYSKEKTIQSDPSISIVSACGIPLPHEYQPESILKNSVRGSDRFWLHETQIMNRAIQGCQYAQRLWKGMASFAEGMVCLMELLNHDSSQTSDEKSRLSAEMFHHISNSIRLNDLVVSFPLGVEEKFVKLTEDYLSSTPDDKQNKFNLDVRVSYTYLLKSSPKIAIFIEEFKQKYPHESYFYEAHCDFLVRERLIRKGLEVVRKALELCPNNYNLMYNLALFSNFALKSTTEEMALEMEGTKHYLSVIETYENYLKSAPPGHRNIPECYYSVSQLSIHLKELSQAKNYFDNGEQAERNLLACFLPYHSVKKEFCKDFLTEKAEKNHYFKNMQSKSINLKPPEIDMDMKMQVGNPKRCALVIKHREKINYCSVNYSLKGNKQNFANARSEQNEKAPVPERRHPLNPKEITFQQMDPIQEKLYEDCLINLVIMEDSIFDHLACVQSVVKDDKGDFQLMYINNMEHDVSRKFLGFGAKITVFNPSFRLNLEGGPGIWIDDQKSIFYHWTGDDKPICRFCWMENPAHTCSNCKRARYCSRECQNRDWKLLKHKLICSPNLISDETDD